MICIIENVTPKSFDFVRSLRLANINCPIICCEDDGFLPDGIESPFTHYTQDATMKGYPRYFNHVEVPDYWEVRGNNSAGEIAKHDVAKANIFYSFPTHQRYVRAVEWMDDKQVVRSAELYHKNGRLFSKITYSATQQPMQRLYFNQNKEVVIVENYNTGSIQLNQNGRQTIFGSKSEFLRYYIEEKGYDTQKVFYNTLSTPFFYAVEQLPSSTQFDVLFWQEPIHDEVPGNMRVLFERADRKTIIAVDNQETYERLKQFVPSEWHDRVVLLGYVYEYIKLNNMQKEVLILTNSDQIANVHELISRMNDMHFHIAAITEMSPALMALASHSNVSLYPNVSSSKVNELYQRCDVYLDINYGDEILDAVRTAFNHNMLIVAYHDTCHNDKVTAISHRYALDNTHQMIGDIRYFLHDASAMERALNHQKRHAGQVSVDTFQYMMGVADG